MRNVRYIMYIFNTVIEYLHDIKNRSFFLKLNQVN